MKKLAFILALVFGLATVVVAQESIENEQVKGRMYEIIKQLRNSSVSFSSQISSLRSEAISLKTNYPGAFASGDNTKINTLGTNAQTAASAADAVITTIDTEYPSISG